MSAVARRSSIGAIVRCVAGALLLCVGLPAFAAAPDTPPAAVATAHPMATAAGHEILEAGGNAFDAAVAVSATLAVVEPYSSGMGGGGFWLLHRADDGREVMIDGRERAPSAAHRDLYLDADGNVVADASIDGPLAAGIPGQPAALVHIAERYGKLSLRRSLEPAVRAAREGFPVDAHYRRMAGFRLEVLRRWPAARSTFLKEGDVPPLGYTVRQPALAATLERLGEEGASGFYRGPVAQALVEGVRAEGGIWTLEDLRDYSVVEREPVRGRYGDLRIVSAAPPSSGGVALVEMLNVLQGYDLQSTSAQARVHLIVEAMRRAYRDRAEFLGDPDYVDVPVARLTHPFYAAGLRGSIRMDQVTPSADLPGVTAEVPDGTHTTHFSILDRDGNRVSATLSINYPFGSGYMPDGTGVLLNDEMDDFSAKPGVPNVYGLVGAEANAIAPGKRPLSSMSPSFVESPRGLAILGTPGGSRIITMVLLGILEYADGGDASAIVQRKRFHHQYLPDVVQYEADALGEALRTELNLMGHTLKKIDGGYGNMQAVTWDYGSGAVTAASDPRGIGTAEVRPADPE